MYDFQISLEIGFQKRVREDIELETTHKVDMSQMVSSILHVPIEF